MGSDSISSLKYVLGLLTGGFRANHPLKSCSQCDRESTEEVGTTIWRLIHQLPTSLNCHTHGAPLWVSRTKSDGTGRFNWQLPGDQQRSAKTELHAIDERISNKVSDIGRGIFNLGPEFTFDSARLTSTMRERLQKWGLLTPNGSVRQQLASRSLLDSVGPLGQIAILKGLPIDRLSAERLIRGVLAANPKMTHPLKHIAIIAWLWPVFSSFFDDYRRTERAAERVNRTDHQTGHQDTALHKDLTRERKFVALLEQGKSISNAAITIGISVATAQRIAAKSGFRIPRRPKKLNGDRLGQLIHLAGEGATKHDIATSTGVDPQTVMRVINTTSGLKNEWDKARKGKILRSYRAQWLSSLERSMPLGIKAARRIDPAAYAWLYRNDRDWLSSINGKHRQIGKAPDTVIDWAERDAQFAQAIVQARRNDLGCGSTTLGRLCEHVPELRAKIRQLYRLPQTADQVKRAIAGAPMKDV